MNRFYEWHISSTGIQRIITRIVFIILTYNVSFANNRKKTIEIENAMYRQSFVC